MGRQNALDSRMAMGRQNAPDSRMAMGRQNALDSRMTMGRQNAPVARMSRSRQNCSCYRIPMHCCISRINSFAAMVNVFLFRQAIHSCRSIKGASGLEAIR